VFSLWIVVGGACWWFVQGRLVIRSGVVVSGWCGRCWGCVFADGASDVVFPESMGCGSLHMRWCCVGC
jgi:hypothetical protein